MNLKDYLLILRRNVALLIIATIIGGLGGLGVALLLPAAYSARTELFISIATTGDPNELQIASTFIQERIQTYVDMADSRAVVQPVVEQLDLNETADQLAERIEATSDEGTVLVTIEATDDTAEGAAELSAAVADSLVRFIDDLETPGSDERSQIQLTVANPPVPPLLPDGLPLWLKVASGLVLGLAFGFGLALLRSALDTKIRSKEDIERLISTPVLTSIPVDSTMGEKPLITQVPIQNVRGESFRRLRANLRFAQVDDGNPTVLVTSAVEGEGKTTTSVNLAISLAQQGQRVALVDVDLRQPSVADRLGLENSAGLTTALLGEIDVNELMQPWGADELYVLTAGAIPPNPAELLDSRAMSRVLAGLVEDFDSVILDGPPLLPVSDSLVVGKSAGRVLLVAGVGQVRTNEVQEAMSALEILNVPVSLVLNKVPTSLPEMKGYAKAYSSVGSAGFGDDGRVIAPSVPSGPEGAGADGAAAAGLSRNSDDPLHGDWNLSTEPIPHVWPAGLETGIETESSTMELKLTSPLRRDRSRT
ncbi:polysaccharide biosynthesis tyrosine autokinase [Brevibacterium sp.]|uniref:polysaccharide biosynthesis tyrosine autokinase n=1 Tax=Brevibacterium sp. TaxID=1701 RepID=UPI002812288D|nr:polysaccharide biosynthesis tyrosine autokinase [Brevibacterium sp.]